MYTPMPIGCLTFQIPLNELFSIYIVDYILKREDAFRIMSLMNWHDSLVVAQINKIERQSNHS